jgi:hypothetical protein
MGPRQNLFGPFCKPSAVRAALFSPRPWRTHELDALTDASSNFLFLISPRDGFALERNVQRSSWSPRLLQCRGPFLGARPCMELSKAGCIKGFESGVRRVARDGRSTATFRHYTARTRGRITQPLVGVRGAAAEPVGNAHTRAACPCLIAMALFLSHSHSRTRLHSDRRCRSRSRRCRACRCRLAQTATLGGNRWWRRCLLTWTSRCASRAGE